MNILTRISQFFRRLFNRGKESLAAELKRRLPQIEDELEMAALRWAGQIGNEPLSSFVRAAIKQLGLSAAANRFIDDLIERRITLVDAGLSRTVLGSTMATKEAFARRDIAPMLTAIKEEADKA